MTKIDILNRDEFVDRLLRLVENISDKKSTTCFAINGAWGCGKSFVLDMFEEKLNVIQSEDTFTDKYFVIRYNSWKFDYYEEPLVAIVATMISLIEEKTKLFPDSQKKREVLGMLKATGYAILSIVGGIVKDKTGLDFLKAYNTVSEGRKSGDEQYERAHEYDVYFAFNKMVKILTGLLQELAESYTVIILVDELDRCLPAYAIKVLERLHHLTEGTSNIITIAAIDKNQLMTSVKQIFGFEKPEKYLEKFFHFEVKLDCGAVSEQISEKHADYFELFDKNLFPFEDSVEECLQAIFKDIDIRTQEQLIEKAKIAHKLLYSDKKDYSFMCMELLLSVLICVNDSFDSLNNQLWGNSIDDLFTISRVKDSPAYADPLTKKVKSIGFRNVRESSIGAKKYILPKDKRLYGAIAYTWYWMHEETKSYCILRTTKDEYESISNNHEELQKFAETLCLIK